MNIQKCLFCPLLPAILVTTDHYLQINSAPLEVVKGVRFINRLHRNMLRSKSIFNSAVLGKIAEFF